MEDQKRILEEVFGESSSSETEYENEQLEFIHTDGEKKNHSWERVKEIDGLWLCSDFLSPERQCQLLSSILRGESSLSGSLVLEIREGRSRRAVFPGHWMVDSNLSSNDRGSPPNRRDLAHCLSTGWCFIDTCDKIPFIFFMRHAEGWFTEASHNQAMRFGDLPQWALELSEFVLKAVLCSKFFSELCGDLETPEQDVEACPLPLNLLSREPLFDQLIVNVYQPGEGICSHVDLLRFDDGIAIVSLESACVMHFTRAVAAHGNEKEGGEKDFPDVKVPVLLLPGSLVLMSGEARYHWKHEINRKPGFQVWEGQEIDQSRRTSVTLRRLRAGN